MYVKNEILFYIVLFDMLHMRCPDIKKSTDWYLINICKRQLMLI